MTSDCNYAEYTGVGSIRRWQRVENWNKWAHSQENARIKGKIETLTGKKQNIIFIYQWCSEQLLKKRLKDKRNVLLTVNGTSEKSSAFG